MPAVDGVVRWRLADLAQRLFEEFRVTIGETALGRTLRQMGYRKLSARPRHHAQDPAAAAAFKKTSRPAWRRSPRAIRASR
jgi:transposase